MPHAVFALLALWFAIVTVLSARGTFVASPGEPPLALIGGVVLPLLVFFTALRAWPAFRRHVLGADLRLVAAIQGWRVLGFAFIALHVHGVLPGLFAWPAGLGDMAIGAAAPWIARALERDAEFVRSRRYRLWNVLGVLDLVLALTTGALASGLVPGLVGEITTEPVARLPLVFVPVYLVPIMLMLHATGLLQARRRRPG